MSDSNYKVLEVQRGRFGKMVVALRPLPARCTLMTFKGRKMNFEETKKQDDKESFALQTGPDEYLFLDPPACYFNHSCEPNCGLTPYLELVTLRDVDAEEELTYDYSTTMFERSWTMACSCGKKTCRKIVRDFDQLPASLQQRYIEQNIVQPYIVDQLRAK